MRDCGVDGPDGDVAANCFPRRVNIRDRRIYSFRAVIPANCLPRREDVVYPRIDGVGRLVPFPHKRIYI